jgi:hypothetical protein
MKIWKSRRERMHSRCQSFRVETVLGADQEFDMSHSADMFCPKGEKELLDLSFLGHINS